MRILVIAYEFPPSPSPQSLRWAYLARELDALGHEVHVLTVDLGGDTPGLPELPDSVTIHRTFPGPLRGAFALRRRYRERHPRKPIPPEAESDGTQEAAAAPLRPPRNWKQRISEFVQFLAAYAQFPDIRGEWRPQGSKALRDLLTKIGPDIVISSHEPATTLELALTVGTAGKPWIADLGDPVLATYTPRRWEKRSKRVEAETLAKAAAIIVTTTAARELLAARHGRSHAMHVLTQGFDLAPDLPDLEPIFDPERLELLYTGSLYRFRRIDPLLSALGQNPVARLNIASVTVPEEILRLAQSMPAQVRLLGFMPHTTSLRLQRQADVLVNIANDDASQVPGKFYEYLGAQRPILHLQGPLPDAVTPLLSELRRGWTCSNDATHLARLLADLAARHREGTLAEGLDLDLQSVQRYSWQTLAKRLELLLMDVVATAK